MKRSVRLALAVSLVTALSARAEVSVVLNRTGDDVAQLRVRTDPEAGTIWSVLSTTPPAFVLNPGGDVLHDGFPTSSVLAMPTHDPVHLPRLAGRAPRGGPLPGAAPTAALVHCPLVVWSRSDGNDYELVYSLWDFTSQSWRNAAYVERVDNSVDDTDPKMVIRGLEAYVVWTRASALTPKMAVTGRIVYVGASYDIQWDTPFAVPPELVALSSEEIATLLPAFLDAGSTPSSTRSVPFVRVPAE